MNLKHNLLTLFVVTIIATAITSCKVEDVASYIKKQTYKVEPSPMVWHNGGGGTVKFNFNATLEPFKAKNNEVEMGIFFITGDYTKQSEIIEVTDEVVQSVHVFRYNTNDYLKDAPPPINEEVEFRYSTEDIRKGASTPDGNIGSLWVKGKTDLVKSGNIKKSANFPEEEAEYFMLPGDEIGIDLTARMVKEPLVVFKDGYGVLGGRPNAGTSTAVEKSPFAYAIPSKGGGEQADTVNLNFEKGISVAKNNFMNNKKAFEVIDLFVEGKVPPFRAVGSSSHSPEGSESVNTGLSKNRANNLKKAFFDKMQLYNYKKEDFSKYEEGFEIDAKVLAQTWPEFLDLVAKSSALSPEQKEEISGIVKGGGSDFVQTEKKLAALPYYKTLASQIYPYMRYARVVIYRTVATRSMTELSALGQGILKGTNKPGEMTEAEYLTLTANSPDAQERVALLDKAKTEYTTAQIYNNAGAAYMDLAIRESDLNKRAEYAEKAKKELETSLSKNPTYEANYNMAMVYLASGDVEGAKQYLNDAMKYKSAGDPTVDQLLTGISGYNKIMNATEKSHYQDALNDLNQGGDYYYVHFNKGLAKYMLGQYNDAKGDFEKAAVANPKNGDAYYIHAICAAKTSDYATMSSSLKKAFGIDASLKDYATKDAVFYQIKKGGGEAQSQFEAAF